MNFKTPELNKDSGEDPAGSVLLHQRRSGPGVTSPGGGRLGGETRMWSIRWRVEPNLTQMSPCLELKLPQAHAWKSTDLLRFLSRDVGVPDLSWRTGFLVASSPFIPHHVTAAQVKHYRNQTVRGCKGCSAPRALLGIRILLVHVQQTQERQLQLSG